MNFPLSNTAPAYKDYDSNDTSYRIKAPGSVPKKVLVIENNKAILDVMKIIITEAGYTFLSPLSDFVPEKISALQPDLILIEDHLYHLPQGREISRSLKRSALTSSIPIIIMTTTIETGNLLSESEADALLIKPFDIKSLETLLYRCAQDKRLI